MSKPNPKRGRPKSNRPIRTLNLTMRFDEEYDADLLRAIDATPNGKKWSVVKSAIRSAVTTP